MALPFERRSQLLVYLALKRGWVGRAELAAMLLAGAEPKLAFANLRKTLFRLQALPWGRPIELQGQTARPGAADRRRRVRGGAARRPDRRGACLATPATCSPASTTPAALPGPAGSAFERDRLRTAWRGAVAATRRRRIDAGEAVALTGRLLEADPLDEAALRLHLQALAQSGQGGRARQAYRAFAARLPGRPGPGARRRAAGAARHPGRRRCRGRPRSPPPAAEVAADDDGFVGRSIELTAHRRDAGRAATAACSCLVGPGGVGKTRLARRLMAELAPRLQRRRRLRRASRTAATPAELGSRLAREVGAELAGSSDPFEQAIDVAARLAAAAGARQLRAARRRRAADRDAARPLPAAAGAGHDPGAPGQRLRVDAFRSRACPCPRPTTPTTSRPSTRCGCSCARRAPGRADLPRRRRAAGHWSTSAARSAACRSRSSWRPRGRGCCRARRSPPSCARAASCCARSTRRGRRARPASRSVFDHAWKLLGAAEREALARLSVFRGGFSAEAARAVAGAAAGARRPARQVAAAQGRGPLLPPSAAASTGRRSARPMPRRVPRPTSPMPGSSIACWRRCADRSTTATARRCARSTSSSTTAEAAWQHAPGGGGFGGRPRRQRPDDAAVLRPPRPLRRRPRAPGRALAAPASAAVSGLRPLLQSIVGHLLYRLDRYPEAIASASAGLAEHRGRRRPRRPAAMLQDARAPAAFASASSPTPVATTARPWRRRRPKAIRTTPRRCSTTWRWSRRRWATTTIPCACRPSRWCSTGASATSPARRFASTT